MGFNFAGIQRQAAALEPIEWRRSLQLLFFFELLDETVQACAILTAHVNKLKAHTEIGTAVANDAAGADFATGDVEKDFGVSTG